MENKKLKDLTAKIKENPENYKPILEILERVVGMHKALKSGTADFTISQDPILKKEAGENLALIFSDLESDLERKTQLQETSKYFVENYKDILTNVYHYKK